MLDVTGEQDANGLEEVSFEDAAAGLSCRITLSTEVVAGLRQGPLQPVEDDRRRFVRFGCRRRGILECQQTLPAIGRQPARYLVLVKDVSRSGVGFLHETQLLPRERCELWIEGGRRLPIEVARCRRLQEGCYEVGARFV